MTELSSIPIFPLTGTLLLPEQSLPLNLFEPRYVAMGKYAFENRLPIGMIQPVELGGELFEMGCAGKIVDYVEQGDGRIELVLEGAQRFLVAEELPMHDAGFRLITPQWHEELAAENATPIEASEVMFATRRLMEALGMRVAAEGLEMVTGEELVDVLCMLIPFPPEDKQLLLEAESQNARFDVLKHLVSAYGDASIEASEAMH